MKIAKKKGIGLIDWLYCCSQCACIDVFDGSIYGNLKNTKKIKTFCIRQFKKLK